VRLRKAISRTLQAALLFWKLLSNTLKEWGLKINIYDRLLQVKQLDGKQRTIK